MNENLRAQLQLLPDLLFAHITLSVLALLIGIGTTIPLAWIAMKSPAARSVILAAASIVQTIPSLALLALMVAAFGLFDTPAALIALTAYSILPIIRNTMTGLTGIDPAIIDAARGIGMTDRQLLLRIRLPLAAPTIIAGVRTATVWVVGIATLSTPVGADSLGNFIFSGLQTRNTTAVLVGVAAAALLALVLDALIRLVEIGLERRSKPLVVMPCFLLCATLLGSLIMPSRQLHAQSDHAGSVTIGAKTFTEQFVLAQAISIYLREAGFVVATKQGLGSTVAFDALRLGRIDVYVDYAGTVWTNYMKRVDHADRTTTIQQITQWLMNEHGILCLGDLGFENTYALALTHERARQLDINTIRDLTPYAGSLSIAGDYEFFARPEWASLRAAYELSFGDIKPMDATLMYESVKAGHTDVVAAFSTDGRIPAYDLVVLDDPFAALPPYDAILLLSPRAASDPALVDALRAFIGNISSEAMREANRSVDLDRQTIDEAARQLLPPSAPQR